MISRFKTFFTFSTLLSVLLLTACSSNVTSANLDKINEGMTTAEVKAILGEPTEAQSSSALGLVSGTTYIYRSGSSEIEVNFVNDKVMTKKGDFK